MSWEEPNMKSKTSLFNKAVFKRNLSGNIGLWAGLIVLYLALLPLIFYYTVNAQWIIETEANKRAVLVEQTVIEHIWSQGAFVPLYAAAALITAMFLFSYLFSGRNSNMMHTYPVSRMSLLCTNYITGMIFLTVPQIFASILTMLIGFSYGAPIAAVMKCWLLWIVVTFVENLFFFSMSVCVLMFVGNIVAVPVLYVILNFLYRGCIMIFQAMLETVCYGVVGMIRNTIGELTPIIYMSRNIVMITAEQSGHYEYSMAGGKQLAVYFAVAVLFTVIAVAAYQKKHIETAGDVITVGWLKPIFRWGVAICTSALGALFISSMLYNSQFVVVLVSGLIIGAVAFFIVQMLLDKTVRVFEAKRIRECIIYTAVMCVCYIGLNADIFGIESYVPAAEEIDRVQMMAGRLNMYAVDEKDISWVREIHSQIIDSKKEFESLDFIETSTENAYITYYLKDGSSIRRSYTILESEEAGSVSAQVNAYAKQSDSVLKQYFGIHYTDIDIFGGTIDLYSPDDYDAGDLDLDQTESQIRLTEADAKKLYQAVIQDAEDGNFYFDDEKDVVSGWGNLQLDVRDEQGFLSFYNDTWDVETAPKDGIAEIWLNSAYSHLTAALHELGYISDDLYDYLCEHRL